MLLLYGAMLNSVARCLGKQKARCRKLKTTGMAETQTATRTRTVTYVLYLLYAEIAREWHGGKPLLITVEC